MRNLSILLFLSVLVCHNAAAQQDPLYSQYINNTFVINPAYAGLKDNLSATASYRKQWAGFDGSPTTLNASGHISLRKNTMGTGLMVVSDRIGDYTTNEVLAAYSYRVKVNNNTKLSFGLQAGFANYAINNESAIVRDNNDPLFTGRQSEMVPRFGAGAIIVNDRYFVGLSVPRMLRSDVAINGMRTDLYSQHYYLSGAYLFMLSEKVWFKPSTLLKYVSGSPLSVDVSTSVVLDDKYQAGLLTRNFNTFGLILQGVISDTLGAGYVFELPTGRSVGSNFTTHELTLTVRMNVLNDHLGKSFLGF